MSPRTLFEDENLRMTALGADAVGAGCTVSFTGIGGGKDVVQGEEFRHAAKTGRTVIFVTDKARSWFNAPGLYDKVLEHAAPICARAQDVMTVGNSMGGTGAVLFAGPLGARAAVAFGPQISVSRRIIPEESRWTGFVDRIEAFRFEDLNDFMVDGPTYFVVHGSGGKDAHQICALRARANLRHYVFPRRRHNIAVELKEAEVLWPLIQAAEDGADAFDRIARSAGAVPRSEAGDVLQHLAERRAARQAARG